MLELPALPSKLHGGVSSALPFFFFFSFSFQSICVKIGGLEITVTNEVLFIITENNVVKI